MKTSLLLAAAAICVAACGSSRDANSVAANSGAAPAPANASAKAVSANAAQPAAATASSEPVIARCHMGGCSWFRIERSEMLREVAGERLLRLTAAEGGSEHRDAEYPKNSRGVAIEWNAPTADYYFLCSASRPTAILPASSGAGWDAVLLDFVNGPYGVTEAVSAQYVAACHPGEDMNSQGFAARHNYRAADANAEAVTISRPEAIFDAR